MFRHTPLCPGGHLPRKGGDQLSRRPSPISRVARLAQPAKLPISPLAGEMSGRTEGGAVPPASHLHLQSTLLTI
ncbi:lytic murein transglycosylase [Mesorhizobium sp. M3A.F.Ca.ET.080.04.2.1]|nr:lytic murein transglycosylase [Mesorhizobium sp. M3A.F.Ca.ET.080.04.2.1]